MCAWDFNGSHDNMHAAWPEQATCLNMKQLCGLLCECVCVRVCAVIAGTGTCDGLPCAGEGEGIMVSCACMAHVVADIMHMRVFTDYGGATNLEQSNTHQAQWVSNKQ